MQPEANVIVDLRPRGLSKPITPHLNVAVAIKLKGHYCVDMTGTSYLTFTHAPRSPQAGRFAQVSCSRRQSGDYALDEGTAVTTSLTVTSSTVLSYYLSV